ncbi:hypothetical protein NDU88_004218 [Pleurodeles waltl]|uniref:Uncharacterized protein n=1 Tax=Pleurodeles waltl TaxID=8319 RepID=A0AAV7N2E9_PLEWA|nr:hypothetical protein NDU88_004218 [Pleurodeles waltl]
MPNIEGVPCPDLAEAPCPFWSLVRGNTELQGRGTPGGKKHELRPLPEPNAQLAPRQAAVQQFLPHI